MTIKSHSRTIGRMIRRMTGIELPRAMKIGKLVAQGVFVGDIASRFPEVTTRIDCCGDGCCSIPRYTVTGPRDRFQVEYDFSFATISREHASHQRRLAAVQGMLVTR